MSWMDCSDIIEGCNDIMEGFSDVMDGLEQSKCCHV